MPTGPYDPSVTEALNALRMQLNAGVMLDKSLHTCAKACTGERREAFEKASDRAAQGLDIADVATELIAVLSFAERAMLVASWDGGRADAALAAIIERRRLMAEIGRKIKSGLVLPVMVFFVASFVSPLPALLAQKDGISFEAYCLRAMAPLGVALLLWIIGQAFFLRRTRELAARSLSDSPAPITVLDVVMLRTPFVAHTEELKNLAEFCSLLFNITVAGVQTREGLAVIARAMPNGFYRADVERIRHETVRGNEIAPAMRSQSLWPDQLVNIIDVAETSGDLDRQMERMSKYYLELYSESIRRWGVFIARFAYFLASCFVIYHIFRVAGTYVGLINDAAAGRFPN